MKTKFLAILGMAMLTGAVTVAVMGPAARAADKKTVVKQGTKVDATISTNGNGGTVGGTTGGTTALTTSDCKLLLGGQVIQVFDGRCGSSGAYCKSSSGSACITEK